MRRPTSALVALGIATSGCTHQIGYVGLLSNEPPPLEMQRLGKVRGRHCTWWAPVPDFDTAVDRALAQQPEANALVGVAIAAAVQNYILISRVCVRIDADAVKLEEP